MSSLALIQSGATLPYCGGPAHVCYIYNTAWYIPPIAGKLEPPVNHQALALEHPKRFTSPAPFSCAAFKWDAILGSPVLPPILPAYEDNQDNLGNGMVTSFWEALKQNTEYLVECCDYQNECTSEVITTGTAKAPQKFSVSIVLAAAAQRQVANTVCISATPVRPLVDGEYDATIVASGLLPNTLYLVYADDCTPPRDGSGKSKSNSENSLPPPPCVPCSGAVIGQFFTSAIGDVDVSVTFTGVPTRFTDVTIVASGDICTSALSAKVNRRRDFRSCEPESNSGPEADNSIDETLEPLSKSKTKEEIFQNAAKEEFEEEKGNVGNKKTLSSSVMSYGGAIVGGMAALVLSGVATTWAVARRGRQHDEERTRLVGLN